MEDKTIGSLSTAERFWRDRYDWLENQGCILRPRYRPDWLPRWKDSGQSPCAFEDGQMLMVSVPLHSLRVHAAEGTAGSEGHGRSPQIRWRGHRIEENQEVSPPTRD